MNHRQPSNEQLASFQQAFDQAKTVVTLNLLRFRESADYGDFHDELPCCGEEAYARYEKHVSPCLQSAGARISFSGKAEESVIVPAGEDWDKVILVEFPNLQSFRHMLSSDQYLAIAHHRTASL